MNNIIRNTIIFGGFVGIGIGVYGFIVGTFNANMVRANTLFMALPMIAVAADFLEGDT